MDEGLFSWERFLSVPIVGILRNIAIEDVAHILPRYLKARLTTVEVTMDTPNAETIIRYALDHYSKKLNIGAGSVCSLSDLNRALDAGAQFIVTPIMDEQVISTCVRGQLPVFPGAYTPSEIYRAWALGASMVKVFPAAALGANYIRELSGPLKQIKLLPTGGIGLDNFLNFLEAGAAGLGIGSELFDKQIIEDKNWEALTGHFEKFVKKIQTQKYLETPDKIFC
jgi:2-dehydro-3-deoxyphosphogluconate aldolase / (4S)-4-hydroxy-2-oxoglutarate aldolase